MNLIAYYQSHSDAEAAAAHLRSFGIVTHAGSNTSRVAAGMIISASQVGLWSVLEHQHEDAVALLRDADHEVTTGLSDEELQEFEHMAEQASLNVWNKALFWGLLLCCGLAGLIYYVSMQWYT